MSTTHATDIVREEPTPSGAPGDRRAATDHDADEGLGAPGFDVVGVILRCRRTADLSQRDLAAVLGVSPSTVARWETGSRVPSAEMLATIVGLAGYRLQLVDEADQPVDPAPSEPLRDRGGRRMPAHLDVKLWDEDIWQRRPTGGWMVVRRSVHAPRRPWRDYCREVRAGDPVFSAPGCSDYQGHAYLRYCRDFTTPRDLQHWREGMHAHLRDRIAARRARHPEPEPEPEPCTCPLDCYDSPECVETCPCDCGG